MTPRRWLGAAALLLALTGAWIDRPTFYASWLAAWWLWLGVVLGALAIAWMHRLTGGRWGDALAPAIRRLARCMPWVLVLFVPLLSGLDALYPWLRAGGDGWRRAMAEPAFNRAWLSPGFFGARLALYALAWWWMARALPGLSLRPASAAGRLIAHAVIGSLAVIDLVMSLLPPWTSTVFALLALVGQVLAGSALATALAARDLPASTSTSTSTSPPEPGTPPVARDLGNLLLTWVLGWAYLAFVQLLIIWAEDLPREIAWYVPRLQTGWRWAGIALAVLNFAVPVLALLQRGVKDSPRALAAVAWLLVAGSALDAAWLVLPSVAPASVHGTWLVPLMAAGMGLVLLGGPRDAVQARTARYAEGRRAGPAP